MWKTTTTRTTTTTTLFFLHFVTAKEVNATRGTTTATKRTPDTLGRRRKSPSTLRRTEGRPLVEPSHQGGGGGTCGGGRGRSSWWRAPPLCSFSQHHRGAYQGRKGGDAFLLQDLLSRCCGSRTSSTIDYHHLACFVAFVYDGWGNRESLMVVEVGSCKCDERRGLTIQTPSLSQVLIPRTHVTTTNYIIILLLSHNEAHTRKFHSSPLSTRLALL